MLSSSDRAIMIRSCHGHDVAFCRTCALSYRVQHLGADWFHGKTELCPRCRADLSDSIRQHLESCLLAATARSHELTAEAKDLCNRSADLKKNALRLQDEAGVRAAEADAERQKRRERPPRAE